MKRLSAIFNLLAATLLACQATDMQKGKHAAFIKGMKRLAKLLQHYATVCTRSLTKYDTENYLTYKLNKL